MAFTKFVNFTSAFTQAIFNDAHGAMWAINGRLSGFYPDAVGGDTTPNVTPGITSIPVPSGTQRTITVDLKAPTTADDLRFPAASQKTSFGLANGILLEWDETVDGPVTLSLTMVDLPLVDLSDEIPIMIYAQYDDSADAPVFAAARENVIDSAPTNKAKLAFYDPTSQTWQPTPQISVGGIFQTSIDVNNKYGGLLASRLDSGTLKVTPGTVIGSFGRITSSGIRLVPSLSFPAAGLSRKDMLVITDPQSTTNELTQPAFTVLRGTVEDANVGLGQPPPISLDPKQVPLAEIMMSSGGIGQVIDIRPIMAWQTDSMMQSAPVALEKIDIDTVQPGFIATDTTQVSLSLGNAVGWGLVIFRALDKSTGLAKSSSMAIGLVTPSPSQPPLSKGNIVGPGSGTLPLAFTPTSTPDGDFPPRPWILEDSFRVINNALEDVTNDPAYNIKFDFKNGIFADLGITEQSHSETFTVSYRQIRAIFVIDDDGTIHVPELDAFFRHVAVTNPAAHKAFNIAYNNAAQGAKPLPKYPAGNTLPPLVSVQTAIEALSADIQAPPALSSAYLESWRCVGAVTFNLPVIVLPPSGGPQMLNFIGPSGYTSSYSDPTSAPDDLIDDGSNFFPVRGEISAVTMSLIATYLNIVGGPIVPSDWKFSLWIDDVEATPTDTLRFTLTTVESATTALRTQRSLKNVFSFFPTYTVLSGQIIRLALFTPTPITGTIPPTFTVNINLSLDFVIKLT